MANYRKISGVNVKSYSADPDRTYPSAFEGQLYYNSSDGQFKYIGLGAGAWSSGTNMNTARRYLGGCGIQTAALGIAGYIGGGAPGRKAIVEQYDGTSWTEIADLNAARVTVSGCGTTTAAIVSGGRLAPGPATDDCEQWNGTAWSEVADLGTARY